MCLSAFAQEEPVSYWSHNGLTGINFSQSTFSNWSQGGENSLAGNIYLNGSLNYKKDNTSWTNDLIANFGMIYTQANDWRKNIDNLNLASKFGTKMTDKLDLAALLDFRTQMANGYNYSTDPARKVSSFLTPAYLNISVGLDYKPNEHLSFYYSPVAGKTTFVADTLFSTKYGLQPNHYARFELGSTFKAACNYLAWKDKITLKSAIDLFTAYDDSFGNIDVNWDLLLGFNLTKYFSVTFQSALRYDDDIKTFDEEGNQHGAKVQFKEVIGLGLSYSF